MAEGERNKKETLVKGYTTASNKEEKGGCTKENERENHARGANRKEKETEA